MRVERRDILKTQAIFPVGSKALCIKEFIGSHYQLVRGRLYTIREVGEYGLYVEESGPYGWWGWEHWDVVRPAQINWASDDLWDCPMEKVDV